MAFHFHTFLFLGLIINKHALMLLNVDRHGFDYFTLYMTQRSYFPSTEDLVYICYNLLLMMGWTVGRFSSVCW
jgi:hypothetical protein